jgi:hypothetical protein
MRFSWFETFAVFCMLYVVFWASMWAISVSHTRPRPPCGPLPFHYLLCKRTHPYPITLLPIGLGYFRAKPSHVWIPQLFSNLVIIHLIAYEDGAECSETSAYKIQTPGNYPEENIQHRENGESLKSKLITYLKFNLFIKFVDESVT